VTIGRQIGIGMIGVVILAALLAIVAGLPQSSAHASGDPSGPPAICDNGGSHTPFPSGDPGNSGGGGNGYGKDCSPSPGVTPTPSPTATPTPESTPTPSSSATPTPTPRPTVNPTPSPTGDVSSPPIPATGAANG